MCENSCKALWGFRVVVLCIGGGKEKELDAELARWGWPVMAGKHTAKHTSKRLRTDIYKAVFSQRVCLSWLVTWNRVSVTRCVSHTPCAMRDDHSFPAHTYFIKWKGCFATIHLYFRVKRPWWPKGKWGIFLLILAEILVIFKLKRVLLLPSNRPEFHPWEYSVWRTEGSKVQGKTTHYLLNHLVWDILPSLIPLKGLRALQISVEENKPPQRTLHLVLTFIRHDESSSMQSVSWLI